MQSLYLSFADFADSQMQPVAFLSDLPSHFLVHIVSVSDLFFETALAAEQRYYSAVLQLGVGSAPLTPPATICAGG